jgi:hypothetical protein
MEWTTVEWPLGGVDAYTDAKHVQPGKLARVVNGRFNSPPGITKRNGFVTLTKDANDNGDGSAALLIANGVRIDAHRNELCLFTDRHLYSYSWDLSKWNFRGRASHTLIQKRSGYYDQGNDLWTCSVACNAGYILTLWGAGNGDPTGGGIAFSASIQDSMGTVVTKTSEEFLWDARCFALGPYFYIVMLSAGSPETFRVTRSQVSGAAVIIIPTAQDLIPATDTGGGEGIALWDARETERNPVSGPTRRWLLVYKYWDGAAYEIRVEQWDDGAPPARLWQTVIEEVPQNFLTVWGREGEQVFVAWGNISGQVRCAVLNDSTGVMIGAAPITVYGLADDDIVRGSFIRHSATDVILVWQHRKQPDALDTPPPSKYLPYCRWRQIRNSAGPSLQGTERVLYDCSLISRPWMDNGFSYYIAVCFHEQEQGTGFVVEIGDGTDGAFDPRWAGTFGRLTTSGFESNRADSETDSGTDPGGVFNMLSNAYDITAPSSTSARTHMFAALQKHKLSKVKQQINPNTGVVTGDVDEIRFHRGFEVFGVEFSTKDRFQAASWDKGYFIAGARPSWYDGFQVSEHGYAWYPSYDRDRTGPTDDDIADNVGGVLQSTGDYQVVSTYEHEDVNGMRTISGVSRVMTEEVTVNNRVLQITRTTSLLTVRIPAQSWQSGTSRPREVFYRTRMDETEFFRAHDHAGFPISDTNAPDIISLATTATTGDDAIRDNELLYTTGDILPNDGPPPCRFCVVHGDRMWLGGLENPHEMWFSQPFVSTETPRFNGNLKLRFPSAILAAESMDDKLVCFAKDRIYIVTGEGVGAAGGADIGFNIQLVTSDVGIKDMRSLVAMRDGLMFRDYKGIYLIERGMGLSFKGKDVRDLLAAEDYIVGAVVDSLASEVHFVVAPGDEELDSFALVYNYLIDQWTMDEYSVRAESCAMVANSDGTADVFAIMEGDGEVHVRDPDTWSDPAFVPEYIPLLIETPWIKPSTLKQGWSAIRKVLLLGQLPGDVECQIRVQVFYDYKSTPDVNIVYTDLELQVLVEAIDSSNFQIELAPHIQTCQAFKIVITDEDSGDGPDQGPIYQSLVFEVGREEGTARTRREARH